MDRKILAYIALVVSIVFGGLFAIIPEDNRTTYGAIGGIVVAIAWISVGMLGRDDTGSDT